MIKYTTISELRPDGRIAIPKDTRKAGDMKPGEFFQITMKRLETHESQSSSDE